MTDKEFSPGSIRRILMKDFLTYNHVEVFPEAHLNLIVGPNGTGKSTLVCAIFLVFGGTPRYLGRSSQMVDYIKHGKNSAHVQVEITKKNTESQNPIIDLHLKRVGSSTKFHLNGKEVSRHKLLDFLRTYKIQVENLCQFLAQDRVVEFARQTNQELLENTEKAAGDEGLHEIHQRLKNSVETKRQWSDDAVKSEEKAVRIKAKLKQLEPDVTNAKNVQDRRDKLENLRQKRAWLEYERERTTYVHLQEDERRFGELYNQARNDLQEVEDALNDFTSQVDRISRPLNDKKRQAEQERKKMEEYLGHLTDKRDQIHTLKLDLENVAREAEEQKTNIRKVEEIVDNLTNQWQQADTEEVEIDNRIRQIQRELRDCESRIYDLENEQEKLKMPFNNWNMELQAIKRELDAIGDVQSQKLNALRNFNRNAYEAFMWYTRNKQKFQGKVYLPFLSVTVPNAAHAKFVEAAVSKREWFLFVFERFDDLQLFLREVNNELGMDLPCAHTEKLAPRPFTPLNAEMQRLGFYAYISEMIEAPPIVKNYLTNISQLDRIPVGDYNVENNLDNIVNKLHGGVRNFMTENKRVSIKVSKYTGEKSCADNFLKPANMITFNSVDNAHINELRQQKQTLEAQLNRTQQDIEAFSVQIRAEDKARERFRQQKNEFENRKHKKAHLAQQIKIKKANLENLQTNLIDVPSKQCEINVQIRRCFTDQLRFKKMAVDQMTKNVNTNNEQAQLAIEICCCTRKRDQFASDRLVKLDYTGQKKNMLDTVRQDVKTKRQEVKQLLRQACALLNCELTLDDNDILSQQHLPDDISKAFKALPNTLQEVDEEMEDVQARLATMHGADKDVIEKYESLKSDFEQIAQELDEHRRRLDDLEHSLEEERKTWLTDVTELIANINNNFCKFFALFGCAGEIELDKGDDETDYSRYGIKIKVKFRREDRELRELTHQRQSGGERSVSTMLYLLALQELSNMPFRCVDEINQGMDAKNERKIFDLMVKLMKKNQKASDTSFCSAQYFMLTPKLLPHLHFSDEVTVLIVQNGQPNVENRCDADSIAETQTKLESE